MRSFPGRAMCKIYIPSSLKVIHEFIPEKYPFSVFSPPRRQDLGLSPLRKFANASFSKSLAAFTVESAKICDFAGGKAAKSQKLSNLASAVNSLCLIALNTYDL